MAHFSIFENKKTTALAFAPDSTLAISYEDPKGRIPKVCIYTGDKQFTSIITKSTTRALSFTSEGKLAVVCHKRDQGEGEVLPYDLEKTVERCIPLTAFISAISFSTNNQLVLAEICRSWTRLRVYDLLKRSCLSLNVSLTRVRALAFSIHNGLFVDGGDGSSYHYGLKVQVPTFIWKFSNAIMSITPSPDGRLAIVTGITQEIRILEGVTEEKGLLSLFQRKSSAMATKVPSIIRIVFSGDGKQIVYESDFSAHFRDSAVHVRDIATGRELRQSSSP